MNGWVKPASAQHLLSGHAPRAASVTHLLHFMQVRVTQAIDFVGAEGASAPKRSATVLVDFA
jgi:hypothetical protein